MKELGIILSILLLFMLYYTIKSITKLSDEIKKIKVSCDKSSSETSSETSSKTSSATSSATPKTPKTPSQDVSIMSQMFIDIIKFLDKMKRN
jgi:hypothetical protein